MAGMLAQFSYHEREARTTAGRQVGWYGLTCPPAWYYFVTGRPAAIAVALALHAGWPQPPALTPGI
jgi:hypothetical protein